MARDSSYGSYWQATAGAPRQTPGVTGEEVPSNVDVCVIGAGVVGLTCAMALASGGVDVLVLDRGSVGDGITGHSTAKATIATGTMLTTIAERHGLAAAREYLEAGCDGMSFIQALGEAVAIEHVLWARGADGVQGLEAQRSLFDRLGEGPLLRSADPPFGGRGAVSFPNQLVVQPVSHLRRLAREVTAKGGRIHTHTPVRGVTRTASGGHLVQTGEGETRAEHVVVATHAPIIDGIPTWPRWSVQRHSALVVSGATAPMTLGVDTGWSTRPVDGGVLVVGPSYRQGRGEDTRRAGELRRWSAANVGGDPEMRWSAHDIYSDDGLPMVGRIPGDPQVLLATGFSGWGIANGTAAGMDLARLACGQRPRYPSWAIQRARAWRRLPTSLGHLLRDMTQATQNLLAGLAAPAEPPMRPGQGRIVREHGRLVAASVAPDGTVLACSARCTHAGCLLSWNADATTWDCPCHGSRFAADGAVLSGPATEPLTLYDARTRA